MALLSACAGSIAEFNGADAPRFAQYAPDKRPRLALVLGGGGPRGFAHVGVLKVLEANGIQPDLVVGASVGSLIGALYANGMSAKEIEKIALEVDPKDMTVEDLRQCLLIYLDEVFYGISPEKTQ